MSLRWLLAATILGGVESGLALTLGYAGLGLRAFTLVTVLCAPLDVAVIRKGMTDREQRR